MADEQQNAGRAFESATELHIGLETINRPGIFTYVRTVGNRIPDLKKQLFEETKELFGVQAVMGTDPVQCEFLGALVSATGAKKVLEIGVFTGASSLSIAEALPTDGHLYALDVSEEYTAIARKYWGLAGVESKVTLTLAPAKETMERYIAEGQSGSFDFVYMDADKENELVYYELALVLLRPGGLLVIDNVLWYGSVLEYRDFITQSSSDAIRALNSFIHSDQRVRICMLPIADGVTMAVKRLIS